MDLRIYGSTDSPERWSYRVTCTELCSFGYGCARKLLRHAAAAFALYEGFPFSSKGWHAADQFYRASSSATSNYCAAKRGRSTPEFIAKLGTVVEEIDEAVRWLEHMRDARIAIDLELLSEAEQLRKIWGASLGTARRNEKARQQTLRDERAIRRRQSKPNLRRIPTRPEDL